MTENQAIIETIKRLVATASEVDSLLAALVNLLQRERPHFHWVGIYRLEGHELVLGPYVGKPTPHTRVPLHQGICGAAASTGQTIVVDDVNKDPRYLACSLETRSEIVVPLRHAGKVWGEIDIDSDQPAAFSENDRELLERVAELLGAEL